MKGYDVRFTIDGISIEISSPMFGFFVVQNASNLINQLCNLSPDEKSIVSQGVGKIISERFNWAPHGIINSMITQAEILFGIAEFISLNKENISRMHLVDGQRIILIIVEALQNFQDWKVAYCQKEQEEYGVGFGLETAFNKIDWTIHNAELLSLARS